MRVVLVNKSDSVGGAAVVTRRLMEALRAAGVDARMLVTDKNTDSPYIDLIGTPLRRKLAFYADRLPIAIANGFSRKTLFKLDAAAHGAGIADHPWVKEADIVHLNWINQGVLSLNQIRSVIKSGKKIVWTMHDMWNMTGLCHHAEECKRFETPCLCGNCPILGKRGGKKDFSSRVAKRKRKLYCGAGIAFVAVSNWLAGKASASTLLGKERIEVIPNVFKLGKRSENIGGRIEAPGRVRLIFGAARLDDPIKDIDTLILSLEKLKERESGIASRVSLLLFGGIKDETILERIPVEYEYAGVVMDPERVAELYKRSDIIVSTSLFETLPGTLVEGLAYGCMPVSFNRGGQRDIIDHGETGCLVEWSAGREERALRMADGIAWCAEELERNPEIRATKLYSSVERKFSEGAVAGRYKKLYEEILNSLF